MNIDLKNVDTQAVLAQLGLELKIADAQKKAEAERRSRLQIEALVSARHIPVKNLAKLTVALAGFKGQTVYLESYANDPESYGLGLEIRSVLRAVPLTVQDNLGLLMTRGPATTAIAVVGPKAEHAFVYALSDAISQAGHLGGSTSDEAPPGTPVRVFIGIKSPYWFGTE